MRQAKKIGIWTPIYRYEQIPQLHDIPFYWSKFFSSANKHIFITYRVSIMLSLCDYHFLFDYLFLVWVDFPWRVGDQFFGKNNCSINAPNFLACPSRKIFYRIGCSTTPYSGHTDFMVVECAYSIIVCKHNCMWKQRWQYVCNIIPCVIALSKHFFLIITPYSGHIYFVVIICTY